MRLGPRPSRSAPSLPAACCAPEPLPACGCGCGTGEPPIHSSADASSKGIRWGWRLSLGVGLYFSLEALAGWMTFQVMGLRPGSRIGEAVAFFLYDAPKMLLLLAAATFVVTFVQSYLEPERIRDFLARQRGTLGSLSAGLLGVITPFCSCSAVPLFIGFIRAGVPLGVTFSYLVSAPMVNEVALLLLLAVFGWKIALVYAGTGVALAVLSGRVIGSLRMESALEDWVHEPLQGRVRQAPSSLEGRFDMAEQAAWTTVSKVWPHALAGIAVGALIHGYIPESLLAGAMGREAWWGVPFAVLLGVPLYAGTAVVLPLAQTLLAKGAALGTVLAFMMAVTALSLPEMILLRRVLKLRLILIFVGIVTLGILGVGYLFNLFV